MKKILLIAASLTFLACGNSSPLVDVKTENVVPPPEPTKAQVTMVLPDITNMKSVEKTVEFLASDELQGRETGSLGIEMAAQFIEARFKDAGVQPYFSNYRDTFSANGTDAFNIVGVLEGTDPQLKDEVILIGAHYDHIGTAQAIDGDVIANGANDNAAGTTTVLALADHFAKAKNNKRTLVFALFSAEEKGLLGSKHLAKRMKSQKVDLYTMFNIEMVGVPMEDKDHLLYLTGYEKSNLAEVFNMYSGTKVIGFLPKAKEYSLFMRSDNYPFYEAFGVPAQTISSFDFTNFEHYHGVNDEVSEIDIPFMKNVIKAIIPGLGQMANSAEREIKMN